MTVNDGKPGGPPGAEERDPRLDRLYSETAREGPPAHLDAAILAAARREVGARPRPLASALSRWRVPVSIAALVILSVSLVTLVREEGGDEFVKVAPSAPPAPMPAGVAPAPAPQPLQADAAKPSPPAPEARPEPAHPAPHEDRRAEAGGELGTMADRARPDSVPAAASGVGTAAAPRVEEHAAALPQAAPARDDGAMRAPAAAAQRSAKAVAAGAPAAEAESARTLARSVPPAAPGQRKEPPWQEYEKEPPQKWLDRIAELRRQGETALAGEMLAEFKRRFPEHPLPPDPGAR
jgi:hypothetical protein